MFRLFCQQYRHAVFNRIRYLLKGQMSRWFFLIVFQSCQTSRQAITSNNRGLSFSRIFHSNKLNQMTNFPTIVKFWPWFSVSTISASTGTYHQFSLAKAWHFTASFSVIKSGWIFSSFLIIVAQNVDDREKLSYWLNEYLNFPTSWKKRWGLPFRDGWTLSKFT